MSHVVDFEYHLVYFIQSFKQECVYDAVTRSYFLDIPPSDRIFGLQYSEVMKYIYEVYNAIVPRVPGTLKVNFSTSCKYDVFYVAVNQTRINLSLKH